MKRKEKDNKDPHLQAPAEANRDKHINFLKAEEADNNTDTENENKNENRAAPDVQKQWDDLKKDNDYNRS
jgi:hypothetical protein